MTVFILCSSMCLWRFNMYMNNEFTRVFFLLWGEWINVILVYFWLKNETDNRGTFKSFVFFSPRKVQFIFHEKLSISCPQNRFVSNYVLWCALLAKQFKSHDLWFFLIRFGSVCLSEHSLVLFIVREEISTTGQHKRDVIYFRRWRILLTEAPLSIIIIYS